MSEHVVPERLRELRDMFAELKADNFEIKERLGLIEGTCASISRRLDRVVGDVERIKRRLDFVDMPAE